MSFGACSSIFIEITREIIDFRLLNVIAKKMLENMLKKAMKSDNMK